MSNGNGPVAALDCKGVSRWFGGLHALREVTLSIAPGEIFGLVGPNGSGKTTLVNAVTGFYPPQKGAIRLSGREITGMRPHKIARAGVSSSARCSGRPATSAGCRTPRLRSARNSRPAP